MVSLLAFFDITESPNCMYDRFNMKIISLKIFQNHTLDISLGLVRSNVEAGGVKTDEKC